MVGKTKPVRVYWDTNVFIYLFQGCRDRTPDQARAIRHWRDQAQDEAAIIVASALVYGEALSGRLDAAQYRDFDAFMRSRVEVKSADIGIMRKVKELREHYHALPKNPGQEHKLCTPDAIHLATGIIFDCAEFHTFDGENKKGCTGLLKLSQPPGTAMRIKEPEAPMDDIVFLPLFTDPTAPPSLGT